MVIRCPYKLIGVAQLALACPSSTLPGSLTVGLEARKAARAPVALGHLSHLLATKSATGTLSALPCSALVNLISPSPSRCARIHDIDAMPSYQPLHFTHGLLLQTCLCAAVLSTLLSLLCLFVHIVIPALFAYYFLLSECAVLPHSRVVTNSARQTPHRPRQTLVAIDAERLNPNDLGAHAPHRQDGDGYYHEKR